MSAWNWKMQRIEHLSFRAFIGDMYLWARASSIASLISEVDITREWDNLRAIFECCKV